MPLTTATGCFTLILEAALRTTGCFQKRNIQGNKKLGLAASSATAATKKVKEFAKHVRGEIRLKSAGKAFTCSRIPTIPVVVVPSILIPKDLPSTSDLFESLFCFGITGVLIWMVLSR
jgi:hypothetical protein